MDGEEWRRKRERKGRDRRKGEGDRNRWTDGGGEGQRWKREDRPVRRVDRWGQRGVEAGEGGSLAIHISN